jgi:hypothetical protein
MNPTTKTMTPPHDRSGIYSLACNTFKQKYIGQTSRSMKLCYREHIRYIKNNTPQSAYALHILQNKHEYRLISQTMHLLRPIRKASLLIPYEQLYIQDHHQRGNLIPEQNQNAADPLVPLAIDPYHQPLNMT